MLLCGIYSKLKNKHNKWWGLNAYFLIPSVVIGGCTRGSSNPGLELSLQSWVDDDYDNNLVENHQCWCLPQRGSQPIWIHVWLFVLKRFFFRRDSFQRDSFWRNSFWRNSYWRNSFWRYSLQKNSFLKRFLLQRFLLKRFRSKIFVL